MTWLPDLVAPGARLALAARRASATGGPRTGRRPCGPGRPSTPSRSVADAPDVEHVRTLVPARPGPGGLSDRRYDPIGTMAFTAPDRRAIASEDGCSRRRRPRRPPGTSPPSTGSRSPSTARSSPCSAPTGPARPPPSRPRGPARRPASAWCGCWASTPAGPRRLMPRLGVMPQDGGVYPGARPIEVLGWSPRSTPTPPTPPSCSSGSAHPPAARLAPPLGRRAAAPVPGPRPRRPARVVFLDEPTAGIDPQGRQLVRQLVADLRTDGLAVIVTTHDLEEAEKIADRVVIIDQGRVVGQRDARRADALGRRAEIRFGAPPPRHRRPGQGADGRRPRGRPASTSCGEPTPANIDALTGWLAAHDLPLADLRPGASRSRTCSCA